MPNKKNTHRTETVHTVRVEAKPPKAAATPTPADTAQAEVRRASKARTSAIMQVCPGVVNDGIGGHMMRDNCTSCAPFWEQYPTCPVHEGRKLSTKLYCTDCRKHYAQPPDLDLRTATASVLAVNTLSEQLRLIAPKIELTLTEVINAGSGLRFFQVIRTMTEPASGLHATKEAAWAEAKAGDAVVKKTKMHPTSNGAI